MGIQKLKVAFQSKLRSKKGKESHAGNLDIRLPTELWLLILCELPPESVEALSLTSCSMRWFAQPLLFKRGIFIHPFKNSMSYRRLDVASYVARCHARLQFIASPRIASHIQYFSLTPYPAGHPLSRSAKSHVPDDSVVDHVFAILPLLTNLRSLTIHCIEATPLRTAVLQTLPLAELELHTRGDDITWHKLSQGSSAPISAHKVFSFNRSASPHQAPAPALVPLHFLHPCSLEEIHAGPTGTESVLVAISLSQPSFPRLTTLDIYTRFLFCPDFLPALERCPALVTLRIRSAFTDSPAKPSMAPIPSGILPALNIYHGPVHLAQYFATGRPIRIFKLWSSMRASSVVNPSKLIPILRQLGPQVEVLEIGVTTVPSFLIDAIAGNFPKLKELAINSHLSSYQPGIVTSHRTHTRFQPAITIGQEPSLLNLDSLSFGVQIPANIPVGSVQYEEHGLDLLQMFPVSYNPTAWNQWVIDLNWSKIIWNRLPENGSIGTESLGRLSMEHVEYHSAVFHSHSSD